MYHCQINTLVALLLVFLNGGRGVVVQSLRHELERQAVLEAACLFNFSSLVLEPDLDLRFVEAELLGQRLPPLLRDVAVGLELGLQPLQLLGRERRPGSLVLLLVFRLFQFPCPWTYSRSDSKNDNINIQGWRLLLKLYDAGRIVGTLFVGLHVLLIYKYAIFIQ